MGDEQNAEGMVFVKQYGDFLVLFFKNDEKTWVFRRRINFTWNIHKYMRKIKKLKGRYLDTVRYMHTLPSGPKVHYSCERFSEIFIEGNPTEKFYEDYLEKKEDLKRHKAWKSRKGESFLVDVDMSPLLKENKSRAS